MRWLKIGRLELSWRSDRWYLRRRDDAGEVVRVGVASTLVGAALALMTDV